MHPYTYQVSLRIRHSTMDLQVLTDTLGLQPGLASPSCAGYWFSSPAVTDDNDLEGFLWSTVEGLKPHRAFFKDIARQAAAVSCSLACLQKTATSAPFCLMIF